MTPETASFLETMVERPAEIVDDIFRFLETHRQPDPAGVDSPLQLFFRRDA